MAAAAASDVKAGATRDLLNVTKPRLTYFSSRGRAEPVRILLAVAGVDYEEVRVGGYNPAAQPEAFQALLKSGILPFQQLPLYQEPGGLLLVQSHAIIRYIAQTRGLGGKNQKEFAECDMIYEGLNDMAKEVIQNISKGIAAIDAILAKYCGYLEKILANNNQGKGYFVGESLTYVDLIIWYFLDNHIEQQFGTPVPWGPLMAAFKARVDANKLLDAYKKSATRCPPQKWFPAATPAPAPAPAPAATK